MKRSKLICALLAAALALVLAVACTPAPEPEAEVTPVDFADASVTVEYGDDYDFSSLLNVKGSDGETYRATAKVTTTAGETVTVVNGSFRADNLGGYKVTLTVDTGKTYTRTITVNVTRYTIELSGYNENGYPRGEVAVPTATVRDKDGTAMDVEVSYTVTDKAGNPVTVTDGKINAPLATTYTVSYVASANGKELKKTIVLAVVRDAAADNEIESYDCVEALEGTRALWSDGATTEITWLDNFEGESGVVKFDYSESGGGWPSFTWVPRHDLDHYATYDYIVVRAYFADCEGKITRAVMGGGDYHVEPIDATGYVHNGSVDSGDYHMTYDGWKNYAYPIKNFIDGWKTGNVTFGRWLMHGEEGAGTLYIADIKAAKKADIEITVSGKQHRGEEITLNVNSTVAAALTLTDPDGNLVTLTDGKFTAEKAGTYYARAEYDGGAVYGVGVKEFVVTAPELKANAYEGATAKGSTVTVPGAKLIENGKEVAAADTASSVTYYGTAVTLTDNKTFTATYAGKYEVTYSLDYNGRNYQTSQTIIIERDAAAVNEIESFDDPSATDNITACWNYGNSVTKTWLASFEGEDSVVKLDYSDNGGGWPSFTWTSRHRLDDYADYDYIVVRAYFTECEGKVLRAVMGGGDYHIEPIDATGYVHDGAVNSGDYHMAYNGWKNYVYPIRNFIDAWKTGDVTFGRWLMAGNSGSGILYVSSIYAAKKQDVTVTGGENAKVGDEITLNVTSGNVTCTLTVVDPDGNKVTVADNKFTAEQAGKYYVRAEYVSGGVTVYGLGTLEIEVKALADFRAKAFTGTAIVGTAITVPGAELIADGATVETVETAKSVTYGGVAVALTDNKMFTPNAAGDYVVNYEVVHGGRTYTVSQTITVARKVAAVNEIESFDDPSSVNSIIAYWNNGNSATKTWLESFEGETNVVKIEYSENGGGWPSLTWTPRRDLDDYAGYDYIVVRAYFADCEGKVLRATMGGGDYHIEPIDATGYVHDGAVNSGDYHFTYNGWKNYVYPIKNFIDAWKAGGGNDKWLMAGNSGSGVMYVSSIYAAKKQDVTVTGGENAKVGDEITLNVTSGDVTCTLTVVDPDGNAVTVTNGKFTAEKAGKYYVRAEYVNGGVTVYGLGTTEITVAAA